MKKVMIGLLLSAAAAGASFTIQAADVFGLPLGTGRADQVVGILQARGDQFTQVSGTDLATIRIKKSESLNALGGSPTALLQFSPSGLLYSININLDSTPDELKSIQSALEKKYGKSQEFAGTEQDLDRSIAYGLGGQNVVMFTPNPTVEAPSPRRVRIVVV
ncbi:hypothetical protein [Pseudomonas aeruginosa]|uniref:hypothetical protein n=1 Tax=Pseudomonas aeruginosa TaxID=287 RepID=UPI000B5F778F|nr:hypothetical protein [Pseudomonas aeruginosa]ASJ88736.1 hypothetical protein PSA83_06610 [Pseudomonas aeruginosa]